MKKAVKRKDYKDIEVIIKRIEKQIILLFAASSIMRSTGSGVILNFSR